MASLVLQVQQAARLFDRMLDPILVELGLCAADVPVLLIASRREGVTAGQLREAFGYPASSLSSIVKRLERHGYLERARESPDGRAVVIRSTHVGSTAGRVALARIELIEQRIGRRAGGDAIAGCFAVLEAARLIRPPTRFD